MAKSLASRRLSLEKGFMQYNSDDLLFGAMQYLATYHPIEKRLYLTKKKYRKSINDIYEVCQTTPQTTRLHLNKLIERGLVAETTLPICGVDLPCYIFPYDEKERYQIVDNDMLWYVVSTRSPQAVRVYNYLLNIYLWKKREEEEYIFTYGEIASVIGYSVKNHLALSIVQNILQSLEHEGIIKYKSFYERVTTDEGKEVPSPRKKLLFVAAHQSELLK
jgi:hypothetical protein